VSSTRTEAPTTILLVDADPSARLTIAAALLRRASDHVIEARSAEIALYACGAGSVDLIIASARLPGIGADGLCAELRSGGGPPIVAYHLGTDPELHIRWLASGGADSLVGADPALLAARCRSILRRARRRSAPRISPWQHHVGDPTADDR
jgi:DNA-binding response OmpR family regulator